jgi:hypothetical protein
MSLAKFLTTLHDEVLDHLGEVRNFASLLRCSCLIYRSKVAVASLTRTRAAQRRPLSTRPVAVRPRRCATLHTLTAGTGSALRVRSRDCASGPRCGLPAGSPEPRS